MKKKFLKAMSTIEYSLLVAVIIAALLSMSVYIKRAVSARWGQAADTFGFGRQYRAPGLGWEK